MNNEMSHPEFDKRPSAKRIAFIRADWHAETLARARQGFLDELTAQGVSLDVVDEFTVPGAFEIPLLAKKLAQSGKFDGIVAVALVVDGGIYRHDFVADAVVGGLMRVQLDTEVPVFSVVLTPHNYQESEDIVGFFREHFVVKGREAARACLSTLDNLAAIRSLPALS